MHRDTRPNPTFPSRPFLRYVPNHDDEDAYMTAAVPREMPPGFCGTVFWDERGLCIGIKPIAEPGSPAPSDEFDKLSIKQLQTRCGMAGIAYSKENTQADLVAKLRAHAASTVIKTPSDAR